MKILKILVIFGLVFVLLPLSAMVPDIAQQTYKREETVYFFLDGGRRENPYQYSPFLPGYISSAGLHHIGFEFLFYYNHALGEIVPWLATSSELSSDFMTLTINLRQGVKWNDGTPFTSKDVAFTYNMLLQSHIPPLSYEADVQAQIQSVEIVDDYTIKLHLNQPNPRIQQTNIVSVMDFTGLPMVPEHIWKDKDPTSYTNPDIVVTGPYRLIEAASTGDRFVWERRDDWWATEVMGIRPAPKYCIWQFYANPEATSLALAGDRLDVGDLVTPGPFFAIQDRNPYVRTFYDGPPWAILDPAPLYLPINNARYPWNIREARKALSYAIDRDALNEIGMEGMSPPYPGWFGHYIAPKWKDLMLEKYQNEYPDLLTYDPAKTAQIFTGLGWTKGSDGIWVTDNGTRVTFEMLIVTDWPYIKTYGEQMTDQLRDVGIDATNKEFPWGPFADAWDLGEWDGNAMWKDPFTVYEPFGTLDWFHSKYYVPKGEMCYYMNNVRFKNATYDAIMDQMAVMSPDDPAYVDLVSQALDILYDEMAVICTIEDAFIIPYNTKHWTNWPTSENFYTYGHIAYAVAGHFVILNLVPQNIPTSTVYFTKDTAKFRGIDQTWYGPFKSGDSAIIPTDDAGYLMSKGKASLTPPAPQAVDITELTNLVQSLKTTIDAQQAKIDSLSTNIEGLLGQVYTLTTIAYILGTVVIVLAVVTIVLVVRRPKPAEAEETE